MASQTGARSTFNDTIGLRIDLSDVLPFMVDPTDIPLWNRIPSIDPAVPAVKHEWMTDTLQASTDTTAADLLTGDTTITVTDYTLLKAGFVLKLIGTGNVTELLRVTTTPTANPVAVSRGYAGSTKSTGTVTSGSTYEIVAYAVKDGADPEPFATQNRVRLSNFHQMTQELVQVTDLDQWAAAYGVKNKFDYEVEKTLKVILIRAEKSLHWGKAYEDTTNNTRTVGGIQHFVTTNVTDNAAAALTETVLNNQIENCFKKGGSPDLIVVGSKQKRAISGFAGGGAGTPVIYDPSGTMKLGKAATSYTSDFGEMDILLDRWMPADVIYFLDTKTLNKVNGQPFTLENLAKTGTSRKAEITGWFSFEVKAESHNAILRNVG